MMRERRAALLKAFARNDLGYELISAGAYFAYVKHPHRGRKAAEVARRLVDRQNLLALPGSVFGPNQDDYPARRLRQRRRRADARDRRAAGGGCGGSRLIVARQSDAHPSNTPSWSDLVRPSTSFGGQSRVAAGKLVDGRAKHDHDESERGGRRAPVRMPAMRLIRIVPRGPAR